MTNIALSLWENYRWDLTSCSQFILFQETIHRHARDI